MPRSFDLFGDPVPPNHGRRGRPAHIATLENRNKVAMLLALGWTNERIGRALAIDLKTLRKNYSQELAIRSIQRDRMDAAIAMVLWDQAKTGNVAAVREFRAFVEKNDAMLFDQPDEIAAPRLGKKEEAQRAAESAATGIYATPSAPVIN